ncbi:MAG TPA: GYD domain-containing protein [Anaerolineales bacterium]|jgi:uncharacterized protein with GYD domain
MSTYLILVRFTQLGHQNMRENMSGMEEMKAAFEATGARLKEMYGLMGRYDAAFIVEGPDDLSILKANAALTSKGYFTTETLRAFGADEISKLMS